MSVHLVLKAKIACDFLGISTGKMIIDVLSLWYYWCACGSIKRTIEGASFSNLLVMTMLEKFRVTMIMEATKIVVYLQFVVETNI